MRRLPLQRGMLGQTGLRGGTAAFSCPHLTCTSYLEGPAEADHPAAHVRAEMNPLPLTWCLPILFPGSSRDKATRAKLPEGLVYVWGGEFPALFPGDVTSIKVAPIFPAIGPPVSLDGGGQ